MFLFHIFLYIFNEDIPQFCVFSSVFGMNCIFSSFDSFLILSMPPAVILMPYLMVSFLLLDMPLLKYCFTCKVGHLIV